MNRVLVVCSAIVSLAGWGCGGDNVDADAGTSVDAGFQQPDGGIQDAGGGTTPDGGTLPDSGTPEELPFTQWCPNVEAGIQNYILRGAQQCGQTGITHADVARLESYSARLLALVSCDDPTSHLRATTTAFANAIASGRMKYDAEKAVQCRTLGRTNATTIDPESLQDSQGYIIEPCRDVLVGLVQQGAACDIHEECAEGLYCKGGSADSCGGVCQPRVPINGPCSPVRDLCVLEASCKVDAATSAFKCVARKPVGSDCQNARDCAAGLKCAEAKCVVPVPEGASCTVPASSSDECEDGLNCVGAAGSATCVRPSALGEPCGSISAGKNRCGECLRCGAGGLCRAAVVGSTCTGNADCPSNSYCASGACALKPRENEACVVATNSSGEPPQSAQRGNCMHADAFCKRLNSTNPAGTCVKRPGLQETCGNRYDAADCMEGYCRISGGAPTGTCQPLVGPNGDCPQGDECGSGLYCDSTTKRCHPYPSAGQPCVNGTCATGLYCDAASVCRVGAAAGEACGSGVQCASGQCDPSTGTCVAPCNANYDPDSCGCPAGGATSYSAFLLFAIVLLPRVARARR